MKSRKVAREFHAGATFFHLKKGHRDEIRGNEGVDAV